jgi:hypothetical protein
MINHTVEAPKAIIAWIRAAGADAPAPIVAAASLGYLVVDGADCGARPDIAVIDIRGACAGASAPAANARRLAPAAGILIVADRETPALARAMLRRQGDAAFAGRDASSVIPVIREKLRLASLADELGDRIKSLVVDHRPVTFSGLANASAPLSILVAGRPSPLALCAVNAVRRAAAQTICLLSAGQTMRALDHSTYDGAVFLPADENDLLLALARALRRHRDHRRLPIIIASADEALLDRCSSRDGFQTILAEHIDPDLPQRLQTAARRAALAAAMRAFLRSPEGCAAKTGAAGARFFAAHANRIIRLSDDAGRPVSLVGVSIEARGPRSAGAGEEPPLDDTVKTAARLVRAEDLIAKVTADTLVLLLRNTREAEAARVASRLEGVISGTIQRASLKTCHVKARGVERAAGEGLETALGRLIRSLRGAPELTARLK